MTTTVVTIDEGARQRFEQAWKHGPPAIEAFLPAPDDPAYLATLFELVAIDLEMSWRAGSGRTADEYLARFPALATPHHVRELAREEERARKAAAAVLRPGSALGRYRLLEVHARGGFGVVWRAADDGLGREVAVKTMARPRDLEARQRFVAEARVASRLEHPSIVPVHELAEGDAPWYSMKLVRGQTLAQLMRAFRRGDAIAWHRLIEVFVAMTRALAFAHANGYMHRDVKPDNVIVGDFGETVLLDWGLARPVAGPPEPEGTVLGTPGYMPPEQAEGRVSAHDARSDVYALGVTLGEIVALERTVPRALRAIAKKATSPVPADRYRDAGALADDLERLVSDEKVEAHREGLAERIGRSIRRHRTRWVAGGVAAVLAIIGAVIAVSIHRAAEVKRRAALFAEAVRDETRARASLAIGRPADALAALDEAMAELAGDDELAPVRDRIAQLRERARRAGVFATAIEDAWFLSGEERDAASLAAIERGVAAVGPDCAEVADALAPLRLEDCRRAAHRLLLLEAVLRAKRALTSPLLAGPSCEDAYRVLQRARAVGPTSFADFLQSLCAKVTTNVPDVKASLVPASSTDAYMFGLAHYYLEDVPAELRRLFGPAIASTGLDVANARGRAIDLFREALRLEPGEYWHAFMLGLALVEQDPRAAGLAFEHCVSLRPEYPRGLEARGQAAILQGQREQKPALVALGRADFDRALQLAPGDAWTHWSRAGMFVLLGDPVAAMPHYLEALALDRDALWLALPAQQRSGLSTTYQVAQAHALSSQLVTASPTATGWTVYAATSLLRDDDATARTAIDAALASADAPPLARTVRGLLHLRAGRREAAISDLVGDDALTAAARRAALAGR